MIIIILDSLICVMQAKDRLLVAQRMADHVADPNTTPLLILPAVDLITTFHAA
jgi:hypothetical protein